jgi:hypothetical protein
MDSTSFGRCVHLGARENFLEVGSRTNSCGSTPTSVKDLHLTVGIDNYNNGTDTIRDGITINGSSGQVSAPHGFYTPIGMPGYTVLTLPAGLRGSGLMSQPKQSPACFSAPSPVEDRPSAPSSSMGRNRSAAERRARRPLAAGAAADP